jgi:hypothetical protein
MQDFHEPSEQLDWRAPAARPLAAAMNVHFPVILSRHLDAQDYQWREARTAETDGQKRADFLTELSRPRTDSRKQRDDEAPNDWGGRCTADNRALRITPRSTATFNRYT